MTERRDSQREPGGGPAAVFVGNSQLRCEVLNVSSSGMALRSSSDAPRGAYLRIHAYLAAAEGAELASLDGVLVRRREVEAGYEWGVALLSSLSPNGEQNRGATRMMRLEESAFPRSSRTLGELIGSPEEQKVLDELRARTDAVSAGEAAGSPARSRSPGEWWLEIGPRRSKAAGRRGDPARKWWLDPPGESGAD